MRSEEEMLNLIVGTAQSDERIPAVIMNGSRLNPNAPRDPLQDYDIVYIVTDVAPFRDNYAWIARFGELMILQMPENMDDPPSANDGAFAYLMQFADGNRIDLTLYPLVKVEQLERDSLSLLPRIRMASSSPSRLPATAIIGPSCRPPRPSPTAATSSGGFLLTWPRGCGERRSSTPATCSTRSCANSS
jgi:hypothetical protein